MTQTFTWNGFETDINGSVTDVQDTIPLVSVTNLRAPGYLVIAPTSLSEREYIFFNAINGNTLEGVVRGLGGSISGGQAHTSAKVRAVSMHQMFDDLWTDVDLGVTNLGIHIADTGDPHAAAAYLKESDADGLYLRLDGTSQMLAPLLLQAGIAPTLDDHAANKKYVDDETDAIDPTGLYLLLTGGSLSDFLTLHADPTALLHAATKQYVDSETVLTKQYIDQQDDLRLLLDGGTMSGRITFTDVASTVGIQLIDATGGTGTLAIFSDRIRIRLGGSILGFAVHGIGDVEQFSVTDNDVSMNTDLVRFRGIDNFITTGQSPNLFVETGGNGRIFRFTSARKYKSNIQDASHLADIDLAPVTFHHDGDDSDYIGFIADDLGSQDARLGVYMGDDIDNYDVRAVVAILAAKVNRLESA